MLCEHIISNCIVNVNAGHYVVATGIAAEDFHPMATIWLIKIVQTLIAQEDPLVSNTVEPPAKRQNAVWQIDEACIFKCEKVAI